MPPKTKPMKSLLRVTEEDIKAARAFVLSTGQTQYNLQSLARLIAEVRRETVENVCLISCAACRTETSPECIKMRCKLDAVHHDCLDIRTAFAGKDAAPERPKQFQGLCLQKFMDGPVEKVCMSQEGHPGGHQPYMTFAGKERGE